jgi:hypothetical protein
MQSSSRLVIIVVLIGMLFIPSQTPRLSAEDGDFIESLPIVIDYPNSITFRGVLRKSVKMSDLELLYSSDQRKCYGQVGFGMPKIAGNNSQEIGNIGDIVEWKWELTDKIGILGSRINWSWLYSNEIINSNEEIVIDSRYTWHTSESKYSVVYTAYEDKQIQKEILSIADDTLIYLSVTLDESLRREGKYKIFVYPSTEIFNTAFFNRLKYAGFLHKTSDATIHTGFSQEAWQEERTGMKATIAHEMTHAALADYEVFCDQKLPNWFVEGYASYVDNVMLPNNFTNRLQFTDYLTYVQKNGVLPIGEWSEIQPTMSLYYTQSMYIFEYLIATYGKEKPQEVRLAISTTKNFDTAFNEVYGFPVSDLGPRFTEYMNRNLLVHQKIPPYAISSDDDNQQKDGQNESDLILPTIVPLTVQVGINANGVMSNNMLVIVVFSALLIAIAALVVFNRIFPKNGKSRSKSDENTLHHNGTNIDQQVYHDNSVSNQQNSEDQQQNNGDAR